MKIEPSICQLVILNSFFFSLKLVAKSLDYIISHNKFDKMMLNQV